MNLAPLHGAPPRGPAGRGSGLPNMPLGRQDSRSNLAVQPAAAPVQLTLKKAAVKLVQPAKPLTTAPRLPPAAPANSTTPNVRLSTPLPALMELQSSSSSSSPMESKHSAISGDTDAEAILGARFARLDFLSGSTKGNPGVKAKKEALGMPQLSPISEAKLRLDTFNKKYCTPTPDQAASEYLQKAAEYLDSLPSAKSPTVHLVQTVAEKIRSPISPPKITNGAIEHTQAKVANAVTTYVNGLKQDGQGTSMEQVMQFLKDVNGNFLFLCATLANRSLINITCLNEVRFLLVWFTMFYGRLTRNNFRSSVSARLYWTLCLQKEMIPPISSLPISGEPSFPLASESFTHNKTLGSHCHFPRIPWLA